jgi:hypothetical protein
MAQNLDLLKIFTAASKSISKQKNALNKADTYNHDHGNNMVEVFQVVTQAMKAKKGADPTTQLEYAAQLLKQKSTSGSAQVYAQGLSRAAARFEGQTTVRQDNVGQLIQSLLGAGQVQAPQTASQGGDVLSSLLSSLAGGGQAQTPAASGGGLDAGALLNIGLSYMQSKQQGKGGVEALINAVVGSSAVGSEPHRAESGAMVAQALLSAVSKLAK